jgi:hypothetical protein
LQTFIEQHASEEYTALAVRFTRSRIAGGDDLRSDLRTDETRTLRKERKVQKEVSPPTKKLQKVPKKKKQNPRKKKQEANVKLVKDGFPIYDPSLFCSFDAPQWLDAELEWCVGLAFCTNYEDRVTPFVPQWRHELPDAKQSLDLRSVIFKHKDEDEYKTYMYCAPKSFS